MRKLVFAACAAASLSLTAMPAFAQANPSQAETDAARRGPCRDPWVKIALDATYGQRQWGKALCPIKLYNDGRWNSYAELLGYVRGVKSANEQQGIMLVMTSPPFDKVFIALGGVLKAALPSWLVGNDGASLIGNDSGGLISNVPGGLISNAAQVTTGLPVANFGPPAQRELMDSSKTKVRYGPNVLSFPK